VLRIAIYHNLPSGGGKRALYEWTRRLAVSHKIDAFTLSGADHDYCDIRSFVQQYRVFDFSPRRLFQSPWGRLNQLQRWRDLGELMEIGRRVAAVIDRGGYDVVFAHACSYTFIPTVLQFVRVPSIYYLHEPFGRSFTREFRRPYLARNRWRKIADRFDPLLLLYKSRLAHTQRESIKRTTRLLANSEFTQQSIKAEYNVFAPVLHYGVNSEEFRPQPHIAKGNHVISVGEMTPRKGFDFLIESLALIPPSARPELRLVCNFQNPSERDYVQSLAAAWQVSVQVLTNLNTEQLAIEYNKARLCVYAPVKEPFGLVPLEAMACGTPVVGVREGGVSESVRHGETGLLTERDPRQFAEAIISLLNDPERRTQCGCQGRIFVEKQWQWEQSVRDLDRHLTEVARCRQA
jgi:glycosyltransferase involved in cell wall biosynthesis